MPGIRDLAGRRRGRFPALPVQVAQTDRFTKNCNLEIVKLAGDASFAGRDRQNERETESKSSRGLMVGDANLP